jgi:hypothetical protein
MGKSPAIVARYGLQACSILASCFQERPESPKLTGMWVSPRAQIDPEETVEAYAANVRLVSGNGHLVTGF